MGDTITAVRYDALCPSGKGLNAQVTAAADKVATLVSRVAYDDDTPAHVRQEMLDAKARRDELRISLSCHVAACTAGCKRAPLPPEQPWGFRPSAPQRARPEMPGGGELAARIAAGATLEDLAAEYMRTVQTLQRAIREAGYDTVTGLKKPKPGNNTVVLPLFAGLATAVPDWTKDALCGQTDPEMFFPEKGGSTREAKRLCAGCPVQAECLDLALANGERFGIWGGLSERERRQFGLRRCQRCGNTLPAEADRHRRWCDTCAAQQIAASKARHHTDDITAAVETEDVACGCCQQTFPRPVTRLRAKRRYCDACRDKKHRANPTHATTAVLDTKEQTA